MRQLSALLPAGTPAFSRYQRHFATAWYRRTEPEASGTGSPFFIWSVIVRCASGVGRQVQSRPLWTSQSLNFPEGSFAPEVQKRTSRCAFNARNR